MGRVERAVVDVIIAGSNSSSNIPVIVPSSGMGRYMYRAIKRK